MRIESLRFRATSVLVTLVLTCQICFSQGSTNASLDLVVKDPSGALIHKAQVQLLANGKQISAAQTNQKGEARFNKVPPGRYSH
jgi:Carboxypeptidase regulatory-like domain